MHKKRKEFVHGNPHNIGARNVKRSRFRRHWGLALAILLVIILVVVVAVKVTGEDSSGILNGPKSAPFTMTYPESWRKMSDNELSKLASPPLAGVVRKDDRGQMLISRKKSVTQDLKKLARKLKPELKKRVSGFKEISSKVIKVPAGPALFYSYTAKGSDITRSIVIIPDESGSYQINIRAKSGANDVGREVESMILSFNA